MALTKKALLKKMADSGIKDPKSSYDVLINIIGDTLVSEGRISLAGLGTLNTKERAARVGRNPRTGESLNIPAKTVVTFRAAPALNDRV